MRIWTGCWPGSKTRRRERRGVAFPEARRLDRADTRRAGRSARIALPNGGKLYWHNGISGGFRAFAGFVPDRHVGVVVLTNSAVPPQAFDRLALDIAIAARPVEAR